MSIITFLLSIMTGVIANRISKWFDEREHDGDEPRD
ncbi:nitrate reductase [Selenomonas sputigena]|nr:nitrate reductase [Selenomonas sputigena]